MNTLICILGAAAALVLLGVAAELGVRRWLRHWGRYYVWSPGLRLHLHPDREVFPELEPLARIEINGYGERGDEVPALGKNLYRILVAGGSPTECALLDQPTSWPGLLQRLLEKPDHLRVLGASRVHVGNIGFSGVASQHLDLIFERVLPRYRRLGTIIIMIGGNDVFQWLQKGAPASVQPSPLPASEVFSCHPEGPFDWTPRKLALVQLVNRGRQRWLRPVKVADHSGKWVGRARAMRAKAKEVRTTVSDPAGMLDHFEYHFRSLLLKAKAHADRILVVRQPWFERDYTPEEAAHLWHGSMGDPTGKEEVSVYYSFEVVSWLMACMDARAAKVTDELCLEQLNLMPLLEPSLKTYYDFIHFTPSGAKAVAEAVAKAILLQHVSMKERATRFSEDDLALVPRSAG